MNKLARMKINDLKQASLNSLIQGMNEVLVHEYSENEIDELIMYLDEFKGMLIDIKEGD